MLSLEQQNMLVLENMFLDPVGYTHEALLKMIISIKDEVYDVSQDSDVILKIILRLFEKLECFLCQTSVESTFVKKRLKYKTVDDFRETLNQMDQAIEIAAREISKASYTDLQRKYLTAAIQYALTVVGLRVRKLQEINDNYFLQCFDDTNLGNTLSKYGFDQHAQLKR